MDNMTFRVVLDPDLEHEVHVDQRDLAAVEASDYINKTILRLRYMAFNAMKRSGQYAGTWDRFNETDAIFVGDQVIPPADPTNPGATAGT